MNPIFGDRNYRALPDGTQTATLQGPPWWERNRLIVPDPQQLPINLINGMPMQQYVTQVRPALLYAQSYRHYDTRVIVAGQNITAGTYRFFAVPQNGSETSIDGSINILSKTPEYTNALTAQTIEGGNTLICDSLQFEVCIPHRDWNALTTATGLPSTGAPSATDTNSATNTLSALILGTYIQFGEPNKPIFTQGQIDDFPDPGGLEGSFGGATSEGFIRVARGKAWLDQVVLLQELHQFFVTMQVFRTITVPLSVVIRASLCGVKLFG